MTPRSIVVTFATAHTLLAVSLSQGQLTTPTASPEPSPTNTERIHQIICGDGILVPEFEGCDDGNRFGGDGCAADCTGETVRTEVFEPFEQPVTSPIDTEVLLTGTITFAGSQRGALTVRAIDVKPTGILGVVACFRGVASDEEFGPGNVGVGGYGLPGGAASINIITVTVAMEQWHPAGNNGPDGQPCTDDDPGLSDALRFNRQISLSLPRLSRARCCGDCDLNGVVHVDEVLLTVNSALNGCELQPSQGSSFP